MNKMLLYFNLGQQLVPELEWALHPFPTKNHYLRFGGAYGAHGPFIVGVLSLPQNAVIDRLEVGIDDLAD